MNLFWLSFADGSKPKGTQFLGACVVEAPSFADAIQVAWAHGCNPGGECLGREIHSLLVPFVGPEWRDRVLTWKDCEALDAHLEKKQRS